MMNNANIHHSYLKMTDSVIKITESAIYLYQLTNTKCQYKQQGC